VQDNIPKDYFKRQNISGYSRELFTQKLSTNRGVSRVIPEEREPDQNKSFLESLKPCTWKKLRAKTISNRKLKMQQLINIHNEKKGSRVMPPIHIVIIKSSNIGQK